MCIKLEISLLVIISCEGSRQKVLILSLLSHSGAAEGAHAASAEGSAAPEGASAAAAEAPSGAVESPKPVERQVEARSTDDAMASMVRVLSFYDTFLINGMFMLNQIFSHRVIFYHRITSF